MHEKEKLVRVAEAKEHSIQVISASFGGEIAVRMCTASELAAANDHYFITACVHP